MAADDTSGPRPAPVVLRIKLRYDDVEAMAQRFAANIGKQGLFVPTKTLQPVGAEVKFELRLANDKPVITGLGKVKATRAADPANPRAAFGMAIELMRVTRESRDVILKLLERRKQLGLPDVAIPMPEDLDAARRPETGSGVGSAPSSPPVLRDTAPVGAESGGLRFTSPRRPTGPVAVAKVHSVAPLAPEPPRMRRAPVHEVIESASGRVVAVMMPPGLDTEVDVGAVLARARVLAGGDVDMELEALRESAAAPIEITVEAASVELALQLGGKPVSRDRSARWATPPPPIAEGTPAPMPIVEATPAPTPVVEAEAAAEPEPDAAATPDAVPVEAALAVDTSPVIVEPAEPDDDPVPIAELAPAEPIERESAPALPVEPDQIADEIHRLDEEDFEEVEPAHALAEPAAPDPYAFDQHTFATEPSAADLERSLEQHLADADADADDDLGIAAETATANAIALETAEAAAAPPAAEEPEELDADELEEIDDFEILAEADEADADLLAADGEADVSGRHDEPPIVVAAAPVVAEVPAVTAPVVATAPVLAVVAPVVAKPAVRAPSEQPASRFSDSDFASRLDLGDEEEEPPPSPPAQPRERSLAEIDPSTGELDPMMLSAAHAIAAFDDEPEPRAAVKRYTPPEPIAGFPPLDKFDQSDVFAPSDVPTRPRRESRGGGPRPSPTRTPTPARAAAPARTPAPVTAPPPAADGIDLETALEALDVDLDDLSMPHAKTEIPRRAPAAGAPRKHPRAVSEDGVLIDFDDDDD